MRKPLYTIANEEFATLLVRTHRILQEQDIDLMIVGGIANQIHVANALCKIHGKPLLTLVQQEIVRLQDHLRATDDVDIALNMGSDRRTEPQDRDVRDARKLLEVVGKIAEKDEIYMSPSGEHLVSIGLFRKGHVRPQFSLALDEDGDREPNKVVSFNLYRGADQLRDNVLREFEASTYDEFMSRAGMVEIPYANRVALLLRVKRAEDLLATKIARGKSKDLGDALSLVQHLAQAGTPIDFDAVERVFSLHGSKYESRSPILEGRYLAFKDLAVAVEN